MTGSAHPTVVVVHRAFAHASGVIRRVVGFSSRRPG